MGEISAIKDKNRYCPVLFFSPLAVLNSPILEERVLHTYTSIVL
jgi:hypothetical protein